SLDQKILATALTGPKKVQPHLPDKITSELLEVVSFLRPWGCRVRVSAYAQDSINLPRLKEQVKNIFGLDLVIRKKAPVIYSQALCSYLENFFIYKPAWEPFNNEELAYYEKYWCDL
ncbi:MAG: hypothetical protein JW772_03845, partial [Candidatus Diapherotrites archaeon]|nr:hypothetical protein [Candidatus Diapherotrites archaeon]